MRYGRILTTALCCWGIVCEVRGQAPPAVADSQATERLHWHGTVIDAGRRPVAGANVYVVAAIYDGRHASPYLIAAISDAEGRWRAHVDLPRVEEFRGPDLRAAGINQDDLTRSRVKHALAVVYKKDFCYGVRSIEHPFHDSRVKTGIPIKDRDLELVLPSAGGSLTVKAVDDEGPVSDAVVRIAAETAPTVHVGSARNPTDPEAAARLEAVLHPAAVTDSDGVARFDDLVPGRYRILAARHDHPTLGYLHVDPNGQGHSNSGVIGVCVRPGAETRFTVALHRPKHEAAIQVLQADGRPASWEDTAYEYYHAVAYLEGGTGSGTWLDREGLANKPVPKPGLWRVHARSGVGKLRVSKIAPPCNEAFGVVGVSPLLETAPRVILTSRWIENDQRPVETANWRNLTVPRTAGRVLHADGSPAAGALVLTIVPGAELVMRRAQTDALGRFTPTDVLAAHFLPTRLRSETEGSPTVPSIVAIVPGVCGAAVAPIPQDGDAEMTISLPPTISIRGRVTVGGRSTAEFLNQIHVLAAHEGRGLIDELLDVQVSADVDGRFELTGLTPGRYHVQAAMDDIWLSKSVELEVGPTGAATDGDLTLDIGRPGVPGVVKCVDGEGKPKLGVRVEIARPAGPLTRRLWPTMFLSDGAGIVNIPPLEVGGHRLHFPGTTMDDVELEIGAIDKERCRPVEMRLVVP